jgi:large subunit ribosomal protein L17
LGRSTAHRKALFKNLAIALIEHERIETTDAKAKDLKRYADQLITLGKKGTQAARRLADAQLRSEPAVARLFGDLAERYKARPGGYTRVLKMGPRVGDNAPMSLIEFVDRPQG